MNKDSNNISSDLDNIDSNRHYNTQVGVKNGAEIKNDQWDRQMEKHKNSLGGKKSKLRNSFDENTAKARNKLGKAKNFANDFKNANSKSKFLGNKIKNNVGNNLAHTIDKIKKMFKRVADVVKFIAAHIKLIGIAALITIAIYAGVIFVISIVQACNPTPHYYCDLNASSSLKKTAVYKQYCSNGKGFSLENLQGHYIIQDGSGPCTDCSLANLMMRYYSSKDVNFFDYLWAEDGLYTVDGQTIESNHISTPTTLRHAVNGGQTSASDETTSSKKNGSIEFSTVHGRQINMANWGYLRDDSLDLAQYEQTSDFYQDNSDNENWVWDLSLRDGESGTTWAVVWSHEIKIGDVRCTIETEEGSGLTSDALLDVFNGERNGTLTDPAAGCLVYYSYPGDGNHAVLITGYEDNHWRIVDPAKGISGGFEGPLDGSSNFAIHDSGLSALFDSKQNSCNGYAITRICYVKASLLPF